MLLHCDQSDVPEPRLSGGGKPAVLSHKQACVDVVGQASWKQQASTSGEVFLPVRIVGVGTPLLHLW